VTDRFFAGTLDELRISHDIRTPAEMIIATNLYNLASEVNGDFPSFPVDNAQLLFKAFLDSDGSATPSLDNIRVTHKYTINNAPETTTPTSINQLDTGDGSVSFDVTISDADNETSRLLVEYSDDGGLNWYDPEIASVITDSGSTDLDNANVYQIGTADPIDTNSGPVTITITWNTQSTSNENGPLDGLEASDLQIRVRPYDGISNGTYETSASFSVDNLDPSGMASLTSPSKTSNSIIVNWTAATTETNFHHYELWFGTNQSDVDNRSGSAQERDNDNDTNLSTITTTTSTLSGLSPSTTYHIRIWAVDDFGNEQQGNSISITTQSNGGGGGGGGGGSSSGSPSSPLTEIISERSIGDGASTLLLDEGGLTDIGGLDSGGVNLLVESENGTKFELFGQQQFLLKSIYGESADILLPSGLEYTLKVRQRIQIDMNNDGCNDFDVRLNKVLNSQKADVTIKQNLGAKIDGVAPNSILQTPGVSTLYYYGRDCKRHVMPNVKIYNSWFEDFSNITKLTYEQLTLIPLSGNVTYRPGSRLVKITTDPKVYAVTENGGLKWVSSEDIAVELFGDNWSTKIDDLPDVFFFSYTILDPIEVEDDYNIHNELTRAQTINIDKGLAFVGSESGVEIGEIHLLEVSGCEAGITFNSFMSDGVVSDEVRELQKLLQCLGYFPSDQSTTAIYGPVTVEAVMQFQSNHGIDPQGFVGPETRDVLNMY